MRGAGIANAAPAIVSPIHHSDPLPVTNTLAECSDEVELVQVGTETFDAQEVLAEQLAAF